MDSIMKDEDNDNCSGMKNPFNFYPKDNSDILNKIFIHLKKNA